MVSLAGSEICRMPVAGTMMSTEWGRIERMAGKERERESGRKQGM